MPEPNYRLPFNDDSALVHRSEALFLDHAQKAGRPFSDASFTAQGTAVAKIAAVIIGGMILSTSAGSGVRVTTRPVRQVGIVLPIYGRGTLRQGAATHAIRSDNQVIRIGYHMPLTVDVQQFSHVNINPDRDLLEAELALLMPGTDDIEPALAEAGIVVTETPVRGIDYYRILRSLISMVDGFSGDKARLERIGVESILTRAFANLIVDQLGRSAASRPDTGTTGVAAIDIICEHIAAHVGKPLTLPQMERLSGLSSRSLSYGFRSRFNCTPQQWQRNFLLDEARRRLNGAHKEFTLEELASDLGFSSTRSFRSYYTQRFGEAPHC